MNHKIRVLFLDIDNTLLDFDAGAAWGMEQCFRKAGLEYRSEMFSVFTAVSYTHLTLPTT